jgi:hypothetical protein
MQCTAIAILLMCAVASALGQSSNPPPPPEMKQWDVWIGDWALSGKAKDRPDGPSHTVDWQLHEHWVLDGFFVQVDQTWKGNGLELHSLELLSYDPIKKIHTISGFSSDGSTWSLTARFNNTTVVENGESRGSDGQLTKCQTTWTFTNDRMGLSGTQVCEQNGVRWTAIDVRGKKSRPR